MVEPYGIRTEKSVEINQSLIIDRIVQVGTAALIEVEHDLKAVNQDVLL